jgi:hypothetical protein
MPEETRRAPRPLALAALLIVIAFGIAFAAVLALDLMRRYHQLTVQAQPTHEMRLSIPGDVQCPGLSRRVPYHAHRPAAAKWI